MKDSYSRANIDSRGLAQAKADEEESKVEKRTPKVSSSNLTGLPSSTYQKSGFGDFTGNVKEFQKPLPDKLSSKTLSQKAAEEAAKSNLKP